MLGNMQQVGELFKNLPVVKRARKEYAPPSPAQEKLVKSATDIRLNPDAVERAYMARQLVQCTLPHSNPGEVERWTRRNGNLALVIRPGWDVKKDCSLGYPYGSVPRLLLFWVITEAVQTKKRRLELGNSLAKFMREVGLNPYTGGGKRGDAKRLREQMQRLFRCHISFDQVVSREKAEGNRWVDMQVAPEGELWWDPRQPDQLDIFYSWIELGKNSLRPSLPRRCLRIAAGAAALATGA